MVGVVKKFLVAIVNLYFIAKLTLLNAIFGCAQDLHMAAAGRYICKLLHTSLNTSAVFRCLVAC